jgi:hypothetical protein
MNLTSIFTWQKSVWKNSDGTDLSAFFDKFSDWEVLSVIHMPESASRSEQILVVVKKPSRK